MFGVIDAQCESANKGSEKEVVAPESAGRNHPQRDASILQVARKRCDGNGASHQGNANRDRYQTCEALRDSAYSPLAQAFLEASRRGETKLRYLEH